MDSWSLGLNIINKCGEYCATNSKWGRHNDSLHTRLQSHDQMNRRQYPVKELLPSPTLIQSILKISWRVRPWRSRLWKQNRILSSSLSTKVQGRGNRTEYCHQVWVRKYRAEHDGTIFGKQRLRIYYIEQESELNSDLSLTNVPSQQTTCIRVHTISVFKDETPG